MIDLHCHILPGLDDGPTCMRDSLEMCRIAAADGIRTIVATPHMLDGLFQVSREAVLEGVKNLSEVLQQASICLTVLPGADVHADHRLPELLGEGEVLTVGDLGRHLMLELPQDVVPPGLAELLFQIQLKGVTPVITHPERNMAIQQEPDLLKTLIRSGSLTQVTAASITGTFGSRVQACALRMVRTREAHLVATDAHDPERRTPRLSEARRIVEEVVGREEAAQIFDERPGRILRGMHVEPPEPLEDPRRSKGILRGLWRRLSAYS